MGGRQYKCLMLLCAEWHTSGFPGPSGLKIQKTLKINGILIEPNVWLLSLYTVAGGYNAVEGDPNVQWPNFKRWR